MIAARTRNELAAGLTAVRAEARRVALVPTMGYLHAGHLSLFDRATELADAVVASIFVNPLQFGPSEDLDRYPRDEERDLQALRERGVALAFLPGEEDIYPGGPPLVTVSPGRMERVLCGAHRPGHFRGVLTVVAKLFGLVHPDVAVFGRKDLQQAVLIRRMVADLELGVEIGLAPVVREADGLAMSSRNALLGPEERRDARGLHAGLEAARRLFRGGTTSSSALRDAVRAEVAARPLLELQYVEAVDPETLDSVSVAGPDTVVALAAFCGRTRLIDNAELG